jgi:hypothetical protein
VHCFIYFVHCYINLIFVLVLHLKYLCIVLYVGNNCNVKVQANVLFKKQAFCAITLLEISSA